MGTGLVVTGETSVDDDKTEKAITTQSPQRESGRGQSQPLRVPGEGACPQRESGLAPNVLRGRGRGARASPSGSLGEEPLPELVGRARQGLGEARAEREARD